LYRSRDSPCPRILEKEGISISLYPNPSLGEFHIKISTDKKATFTAKLFYLTGKMVEDLSPGFYFLWIESGGRSATKKVIIR